MPLATFKDLCIDVADMAVAADFWAPVLGLEVVPDGPDGDDVHLVGPTPQHTVWPCVVPEPKTVKNRVHLDVHAPEPVPAGGTRLSAPGEFPWTVVAAPEGDEVCTFVRDVVPEQRLYELVVDCADHAVVASWWHEVLGGVLEHDDEGYSWLEGVPGLPFEGFVFSPVPEPKTVKNRVHWDVTLAPGAAVQDVVALGGTVLREPDDEVRWTVMADPEGSEFCVFGESA